jgi:predicted dehydrogenase
MDKIRVGVLGLRRGLSHLRSFLAIDQAEVVGACDRFQHYREQAQKIVVDAGAGTQILSEYDELLELELDAVVIASNGKIQVEHACQAMEAGYHVLSEVPGADTEDDLIRLREVVERTGKTYMFGENSCYSHFTTYWRKWILENRFGHISIAEAEYLHYLPQTLFTPNGSRLSPSESKSSGSEDTQPIWRADQPPIQYLTHDLGPLLEILDDRVVTVTCLSAPWRQKEAPLRSDGQIALFHTAKGILIKIMVTLNTQRPSEHRYRLFGTEGSTEMFHYENCTRTIDGHTGGWKVYPFNRSAADIDPSDNHGGTDIALARHFTTTLLEGLPSPIDVYRAIEYTLPGILAARSADLGGTPIPIPDMRREPFTGTHFWDTREIPESDPPGKPYKRPV